MSYVYELKHINKTRIASFSDGADDIPIKEGTFYIAPSQSGTGTPSPSNPRAISGYTGMTINQTGKNLVDDTNFTSGLPPTTIGTDINTITASTRYAYADINKGGVTITISSRSDDTDLFNAILIYGYKDGKLYQYTNTSPATSKTVDFSACDHVRIAIGARTASYQVPLDLTGYGYLMAEVGSTATTYEAYKAKTPIVDAFGRTIYGGSRKTDGTLLSSWALYTLNSDNINELSKLDGYRWYIHNRYVHCITPSSDNDEALRCDKLKNQIGGAVYDNRCFINSSGAIRINTSSEYTANTDLLEAFGGSITFVFELDSAYHNEYSLSPISLSTYYGDNNVWCDTGDTELTYFSQVEAEAFYRIKDTLLKDMADAIRGKKETEEPIKVKDYPAEIRSISGGGDMNYSTEEHEVGTWIDGSPIYEKTLYAAGGVRGDFDIQHDIENFGKLISYDGFVYDDPQQSQYASGRWIGLPRIAEDGNNLGIGGCSSTTIDVTNPSAFQTRLTNWYISIRYIKSST